LNVAALSHALRRTHTNIVLVLVLIRMLFSYNKRRHPNKEGSTAAAAAASGVVGHRVNIIMLEESTKAESRSRPNQN